MDNTTVLNVNHSSHLHPVVDQNDRIGGKYSIINHLGIPSGQADLYLCEYQNTKCIVKLYKPGIITDKSVLKKIRNIKSKRIVPILDSGIYKGRSFEVAPYYTKGDLSRVERINERTLRETVIPFINEALIDVHKQGMAHMDLKPSNIFIDSEDELYLGDFGICSVLSDESIKVTSAKGTFGYRPPESYSEISIKSEHFDYYSFGMTIIHLWKGKSPYAGLSEMQIMAHTLDGKILIPDNMPEDLQVLVRGLTSFDKKKRLGYGDVLRWCKGFDISGQVDLDSDNKRRPIFLEGYSFEGETLKNMSDLSIMATSSHELWNEAIKRFRNGLLDEFVEAIGHDEAAALMESRKIENDDAAFAYLLLKTNTQGRIFWKSNRFTRLEALGTAMQNRLPECLTEFGEMYHAGFIELLIKHFKVQYDDQYESFSRYLMELSYAFSSETILNYDGMQLKSFDDLILQLKRKTNKKKNQSLLMEMDGLMKNEYFQSWVKALDDKHRG